MGGNQPLRTIPTIGKGIAGFNHFARRLVRKCVEASINGGVATDLYEAGQINFPRGAKRQEINTKVLFLFLRGPACSVGSGRQQKGALRVVGNDRFRIASLQ